MQRKFKFLSALFVVFGAVAALSSCGKNKDKEETPVSNLKIILESDSDMINNYSLLAVDPNAAAFASKPEVSINTVGADALINWFLSEEGLNACAGYGYAEYGEYLFYLKDGHPTSTATIPSATSETKDIRLSTTTSVNDSGLLGYVLPIFETKYGYDIEIYSAGTGKAIQAAKDGAADLILVHSKTQEEAFVNDGYARIITGQSAARLNFMYNYFVLVGPKSNPLNITTEMTVKQAFEKISTEQYAFVSRGDNSGTHTKEISLWPTALGITAEASSFQAYASWYNSTGKGMGAALLDAENTNAYILSDKATFLTYYKNFGK